MKNSCMKNWAGSYVLLYVFKHHLRTISAKNMSISLSFIIIILSAVKFVYDVLNLFEGQFLERILVSRCPLLFIVSSHACLIRCIPPWGQLSVHYI